MISFKQYLSETTKGSFHRPEDGVLTAEELNALLSKDPSWCKHIKRPTIITDSFTCQNIEITHLSPFLEFKESADFNGCENLKVAEGKFRWDVYFYHCGIEDTTNLIAGAWGLEYSKNEPITAAIFYNCPNLQVAAGTYGGYVEYNGCPITEIKDLSIRGQYDDRSVSFYGHQVNIQKVSNFSQTHGIDADDKILAKIQQLRGQEKAGGKGEFDDLF